MRISDWSSDVCSSDLGEKARLVMAMMLFDPPNFLVLDEPTNHLDMATKDMLVAALAEFEGTMLFVSHDRHFLAALSNRVLELTPEGRSEEHTSELQSLMRISYAVFCLQKKNTTYKTQLTTINYTRKQ